MITNFFFFPTKTITNIINNISRYSWKACRIETGSRKIMLPTTACQFQNLFHFSFFFFISPVMFIKFINVTTPRDSATSSCVDTAHKGHGYRFLKRMSRMARKMASRKSEPIERIFNL